MRTKILTIGLLSAALATTCVFADTSSSSSAPTMAQSGQQSSMPADSSSTNTPPATQSGATGASQ